MVTALLAGAILLAAETPTAATAKAVEGKPEPRVMGLIDREIRGVLKEEAQARTLAERAGHIERLCNLHAEIVSDPRFTSSDTLKSCRARVWSRLTKIKSDLRRQLAREEGTPEPVDQALEAAFRQSASSMADAMSLADSWGGSPTSLLARGGASQTDANARMLIELIERTIDPEFWDVNGGPGTIMYYPPLQCLVIRATSHVHWKIGGVLGGVRDAGR